MAETIEVGYRAFLDDGDEEFGAIRAVSDRSVTVSVENGDDFEVPLEAVRSVHSNKVVFDADKVAASVRKTIGHPPHGEEQL